MDNREVLNVPDAIYLASGLFDDCHYEEAERLFHAAEQAGGGYPAINGRALCLNEMERSAEALPLFDQAYAFLRDEMISLASNRAKALTEAGRCDEALLIYSGLMQSAPTPLFRYNRALTLLQMGRHEETIAECDEVLRVEPDNDKARFARGFARLVLGDYERGFADYECRLKDDIKEPGVPLWTGEQSLTDKTILVHGEMGLGDNIMFMRYVPMMVARGAKVIIVVPESQKFMVDGIEGAEWRNADRATWPPLDYWVRFMSLAWCFRTTRETVQAPAPIKWDEDRLQAFWRALIDLTPAREFHMQLPKRVGLVWSGSRKSRYDQHRSIPLAELAPLLTVPGVTFYSLQLDVRETDQEAFANSRIVDLAPHLKTFEDTANAMKCLDLVITVDTSVAHMAGTVGVPTWVMLTTFRTYWLWIEKLKTSPWYPSVRVFRQERDGDWSSVVGQITGELTALGPKDRRSA